MKRFFVLILPLFLVFGLVLIVPSIANAKSNGNKKITICHATGSESNPFVEITISKKGWVNGHQDHQNGRDFVVIGNNCPAKNVEHEQEENEITPQILGASISPAVARAKSLPQGGANSDLEISMIAALVMTLASAALFTASKKFKLAL